MKKKLIHLELHHNFDEKILIGRAEWCSLPVLGLPAIKAKIDTGARTSALHAFDIYLQKKQNHTYVSFKIHPLQSNRDLVAHCSAKVIDERYIMSSNGHREHRYIIETDMQLGENQWKIQISLSNRDPLKYRMLLGRQALNGHVLIDPARSLLQGKVNLRDVKKYYR